ncbi:uncharacterized protein LOC103701482 [Phoenix dactylifera]|uniref:Uncharacterized protein LOC103701482 n=1 Tax=Phoenix dactylifera TaxID=42345 RepID=A0A8B7BMV3_PHODC|nr:uncharacterized protein LOC103701482 [Phoenix dactylifera]
MEALWSSIVPSGVMKASPAGHPTNSTLSKIPAFRFGCAKTVEKFGDLRLWRPESSAPRHWTLLRATTQKSAGGGGTGGEHGMSADGFSVVTDEDASWFEGDLVQDGNCASGTAESSKMVARATFGSGTSGSRAGLVRTPISGGVQSATFVHNLPRPALAARNLMEQARFAHLCTLMFRMHHRHAGYPCGSLVDFATDPMGHPVFSLSPLAIHTHNLLADSRCTLVVQIPGWSSLSNARVTIFGDIFPLSAEQQEWAHQLFRAKHPQWASQQWGNFYYYRMHNISDIYFIGGFGTVAWVDVKEYEALQPDKIAIDGGEQNLKELNAMFSKSLKEILSNEMELDDAALISIDSKGTDIRVRQGAQCNIQRLSFEVEQRVQTLDEAKAALQRIIDEKSRSHNRS